MAEELKNLIPKEETSYDPEPMPISPFLMNFIKKVVNTYYYQYKKRHSMIGTKVIATGAAANASLTQKITQNSHKLNKKGKKERDSSLRKTPTDLPKPR